MNPLKRDAKVVCTTSHATDAGVYQAGYRYPATDRGVQLNPQYFTAVPDRPRAGRSLRASVAAEQT